MNSLYKDNIPGYKRKRKYYLYYYGSGKISKNKEKFAFRSLEKV